MDSGSIDMRTPFGAPTQYTKKRRLAKSVQIIPNQKIRVFISSICGQEKYDVIREELRGAIEALLWQMSICLKEKGHQLFLLESIIYVL